MSNRVNSMLYCFYDFELNWEILESNLDNIKELSCKFNKDEVAHLLKLSPICLFKMMHFSIFCFCFDCIF